jgi:hypothetical protein
MPSPPRAATAVADIDGEHTYGRLPAKSIAGAIGCEAREPGHAVVSLEGDYNVRRSPRCWRWPQAADAGADFQDAMTQRDEFLRIAEVEWRLDMRAGTSSPPASSRRTALRDSEGRQAPRPGAVHPGSTGRSKGAVLISIVSPQSSRRGAKRRTLVFLQPDHIGGISTLFTPFEQRHHRRAGAARSEYICDLIARQRVELLPYRRRSSIFCCSTCSPAIPGWNRSDHACGADA